jgi:hypothetical protein
MESALKDLVLIPTNWCWFGILIGTDLECRKDKKRFGNHGKRTPEMLKMEK